MSHHPETDQEVQDCLTQNKIVFIKWGADFCGPCKTIQPYYDQLAAKHEDQAVFLTLETDNPVFTARAEKSRISSIPLFQLYFNGKIKNSMLGANKSSLERFISGYLE